MERPEPISKSLLKLFTRYFHAKKITIQIAQDRGFNIPDKEAAVLDMSLDDFMAKYIDNDGLLYDVLTTTYTNDNNDKLYIEFTPNASTARHGKSYIQELVAEMKRFKGDNNTCISVVDQDLSSDAEKESELKYTFKLQVYQVDQLQVNPVTHCLSGRDYRKLSDEEKATFFQNESNNKQSIKPRHLPKRGHRDPVTEHYGWKIGDVISHTDVHLTTETLSKRSTILKIIDKVVMK